MIRFNLLQKTEIVTTPNREILFNFSKLICNIHIVYFILFIMYLKK